jgi:tripartite-type tricarboxylate transporter receptor subunit TctC
MRTAIGAGAAAVAPGAAASLPHAARQANTISGAQRLTAYEDNRRKKGIDAFPDGGMAGIENGKRAAGSSARADDYIQSPRGHQMRIRPMFVRAVTATLAGLLLSLSPPLLGAEQAYPSKPIRLVVPFPAGGSLDAVARAIGQKLSIAWGQPVIIDNRPGAGGNIGADLVAKSAPDGYTILEGALSTHAVNVSLYSKMPYDPIKDFAPITLVAVTPNVLVLNPSVPANSVAELIAYAKANPGKLAFGSGSNGSAGHLAGELFKTEAHVDMVHVPYKGGAPAMQDLLGGQIQLMFDNLANSMQQVRAGKLKALAVTTAKRSPLVPDLPTLAEAGLPGFDIYTWWGFMAPAGTPKEIIAKWNAEVTRILNTPEMQAFFAQQGAEPAPTTPEQFTALIQSEIPKYAKIIKASGAKVD